MEARDAILRTLAFCAVVHEAPTLPELLQQLDTRGDGMDSCDAVSALASIVKAGDIVHELGRYALTSQRHCIEMHARRDVWIPRKWRRIELIARWLRRLAGVRFVAVCNTTANRAAADESDIDVFIVTRASALWQTRGLASLPFSLLGMRPTPQCERDAVCLSFFVDDTALDLQKLAITDDDPYLRHWFLSLLPIVDDGVGEALWKAQTWVRGRHPLAIRPVLPPSCCHQARLRLPAYAAADALARRTQERVMPTALTRDGGAGVVITDHIAKFHTQDARLRIRTDYEALCATLGIQS